MLRLIQTTVARGVRTLYRDVSLMASPGERIGLVGANGSGKSSLFAAVLDELPLEAGSIEKPPSDRIGHVAQDITATHQTAIDYVLSGHTPLVRARNELNAAEQSHDDLALALAHAHLAELNPGAITAQAKAVLYGLGFSEADSTKAVTQFSGGWRNRLALARTLLGPADLLLLDEPTNHLDLDSVVWLEAWLKRQPATVIVISHDRAFLDRCTQTIWHVAQETIRRYAGNYSAFELAWAQQQSQQDAAAKAYQRTAAHLQSYIDRFRAQATKARQAQSRIKMLERLNAIEPARANREWRFEFLPPEKNPDWLLKAESLNIGYGAHTVLSNINCTLQSGDRIGVLGVNGAGKSTLIKALCGTLAPQSGSLRRAQGLSVGYFAQHQLEQLRPEDSALAHLKRLATEIKPNTTEQELRNFLGQYRFSGDMATNPVGPMSGGEKARCALALIAFTRPNLLVLDEPTNHLDMETREALTLALASFPGALLLVSHDRHLLDATTDQLWWVHDQRLAPFEGDLEEYTALILASRQNAKSDQPNTPRNPNKKELRQAEAAQRQNWAQARKPLTQKLKKVEQQLSQAQSALSALDKQLADSAFYQGSNTDAVSQTLKQRAALATELEQLETQWLELSAQLEA